MPKRNSEHLQETPALAQLVEIHGDLREDARTDYLTELPNRRAFMEGLEGVSSLSRRLVVPYEVICIDINGLKRFNDDYSPEVGDRAIKTVADVMQSVRRIHEYPARTGGDEMSLVALDSDLERYIDRLRAELAKPEHQVNGETVEVTVGIARGEHGSKPERVFDQAQAELAAAKRARKSSQVRAR